VAKGAGTLAHIPTPDRSGEPTVLQAPVAPVLPKIGHDVTAVRLCPPTPRWWFRPRWSRPGHEPTARHRYGGLLLELNEKPGCDVNLGNLRS
jgi:hypothetical protein